MALDFLATYTPLANEVATQTGLDPSVVLGIIDTETSGGTRVLGNNIFGISPGGKGGQYVAKYTDLEAGTEAFIKLMKLPRYAKAVAGDGPLNQARLLVDAGYNTVDKDYYTKVAGRALQFGKQLGYQDDTPAPGPAGGPDPTARPGEDPRMKLLEGLAPKPAAAAAPAAPAAAAAPGARPGEDPRMGQLDKDVKQHEDNPPPRTGIMGAYDAVVGAIPRAPTTPLPSPAQASAYDGTIVVPNAEGTMEGQGMLGRVGEAALEGARKNPVITPAAQAELAASGPLGRFVYNPLLTGAGALLGGAAGGLGQAAYETGAAIDPRLGRDLYMLNQVAPAAAMMPGTIRPGGGPVTPGTIARNTLTPWEEAAIPGRITSEPKSYRPGQAADDVQWKPKSEAPRYDYTVEPFRTREGNIEAQLLALPPEVVAEMAKTNPAVAKWLADNPDVKTGTVEAQAATERRQRFGDEPAPPEPVTPETARTAAEEAQHTADLADADRLMTPSTDPASRVVGPPTRKAAGAAPTTEAIPEKTKPQRITDLDKDVSQRVADRAAAGRVPGSLRDDNVYIEGMPQRTEAHRDLSNQAALDHKTLMSTDTTYKTVHEKNLNDRNDYMTANVAEPRMPDQNGIQALKDARELITPESMQVFEGQTPAETALLERANGVLNDQINSHTKNNPNRATLERLHSDLLDAGNIPSELKKVRKTATDLLEQSKGTGDSASRLKLLRRNLELFIEALDPAITSGAPRFPEWKQAWENASRPINAADFLDAYRKSGSGKSLWDKEGMITHARVQRLLDDIAADHRKPLGKSLGMTDADIQAFVNMRNELAPGYISDVRGKVKGSSSPQILTSLFKQGLSGKTAAVAAVANQLGLVGAQHLAGMNPWLNIPLAAWQLSGPVRQANALKRQGLKEHTFSDYLQQHLLNEQGNRLTQYPDPAKPKTWPKPAPPAAP